MNGACARYGVRLVRYSSRASTVLRIAGFSAVFAAFSACRAGAEATPAGLIDSVAGGVDVSTAGTWRPAAARTVLRVGNAVRTAGDGKAELSIEGSARVRVGRDGFVRVVSGSDARARAVSVEAGRAEVIAPAGAEVSTTLGLLRLTPGSHLLVEATAKSTTYALDRGSAVLKRIDGELPIAAGNGLRVVVGALSGQLYPLTR